MKLVRNVMIGAGLVALTASSGYAQDISSWLPYGVYVRGDVGGAFGADTSLKSTNSSIGGTSSFSDQTGNSVIFGAGVGYRFSPIFRTDLTVDYLPSLQLKGRNATTNTSNKGDIDSLVGLVNGYVDINGLLPGVFGPFQPYVGAGIGLARNVLGTQTLNASGVTGTLSGAEHTSFAWGATAGVGYSLTQNLTLDVGYKYIDAGSMRTGQRLVSGGVVSNQLAGKADLQAHTVTVGLRFAFGAPVAPPAPAPVAAPPAPRPAAVQPTTQNFIVFFEFDKAMLTPDGQKVVDAAAAAFKSGKSNVSLTGYTDRSGTDQYNMRLSQKRADAVRASLVRDGVPANVITTSAKGEANPRVPTADGVREPQNRRVEIVM
jgi:outer membrane protein OmpA-like peptidoglycan-associated protein